MTKLSTREPPPRETVPHDVHDVHAEGWEHALEAVLAVLREIDARYERDRANIESGTTTEQTRAQLLLALEGRHRRDREPYVLTLADLHQCMMDVMLTRSVH